MDTDTTTGAPPAALVDEVIAAIDAARGDLEALRRITTRRRVTTRDSSVLGGRELGSPGSLPRRFAVTEGRDPAEIITEPGSRARDHLANERTYLAWLRTAATVMVLGLAVAKLVEPTNVRTIAAGAILVATGAAGLLEAGVRYRRVNKELEQGRFVTGSMSGEPLVAGAVLVVAIVVAFVLLLA